MNFALSPVGAAVLANFIALNVNPATGPTLAEAEERLQPAMDETGETEVGLQITFNMGECTNNPTQAQELRFTGDDVTVTPDAVAADEPAGDATPEAETQAEPETPEQPA